MLWRQVRNDPEVNDSGNDSPLSRSLTHAHRSGPTPKHEYYYHRDMIPDSTEDIDYSQDSAKDIMPPYSYAQLIGQAILSSREEMLTLAGIYDFIKSRYAFFRYSNVWQVCFGQPLVSLLLTSSQNSIRHNLSLNKCFEKVARRIDEPGKGMKWRIADFGEASS